MNANKRSAKSIFCGDMYLTDRPFLCATITRTCFDRFWWFENIWNASYILSFGGWPNSFDIYWGVFCRFWGLISPKIHIALNLKIVLAWSHSATSCWNDTWHCLGYLSGTDLVKLLQRNNVVSSFVKNSSGKGRGWRSPFPSFSEILYAFSLRSHNLKMLWPISLIQKHLKLFLDGLGPSIV